LKLNYISGKALIFKALPLISILLMPIQKELSEKVQRSFALRKESKHLLEEAKRMVEEAIESAPG